MDVRETLDSGALARDAAAMLRVPSLTGDERPVLAALADLAAAAGLETGMHEHDLAALRAHPDHSGEAPRAALWGLTVTLPGSAPGRPALNGHVDVVGPGTAPWTTGPWSGELADGRLYGRGPSTRRARSWRCSTRWPRCAPPARRRRRSSCSA